MSDSVPAGPALADLQKVKSYLLQLLSPLLETDQNGLSATLFASSANSLLLEKFTSDSSVQVFYVLKAVVEGEEEKFAFSIHTELFNQDSHVMWVAIIKRVGVLESDVPLSLQIQVLNFPSAANGRSNVYEVLHSFIHNAVSPLYNTYLTGKQKEVERDDKDTRLVAKRKIAELELSLLNLQQNVEIPEVHLAVNPIIFKTIEKVCLLPCSLLIKCAASNKKITVEDLGDVVNDSSFLNRLQSDVNGWIKEIQKVTRLTRDSVPASASQEINFWLNMEHELEKIENLLKDTPVALTMDVLKTAKRFMATVGFVADTGIKEAMDVVQKYNILMKDLPLSELLSAPDLEKVRESVALVFGHINKKLKLSPYPISRALSFVDFISSDLNDQLIRILNQKKLMHMDQKQFEEMMAVCQDIFLIWDENSREFINVAREVSRKRSEKFIPIKLSPAHAQLQERLTYLASFRKQHSLLRETMIKVIDTEGVADVNAIQEIDFAYESVRSVNVLDLTPDGTEIWAVSEASYNDKISKIENQIITHLHELLASSKTAAEMFRVFSKFNALFIRPKIRGAIQEYQTQLIENVKNDIQQLHDQFKRQYNGSEAAKISALRDIPPVAGAIIWARQIERQLNNSMKRVEDVLGKGWEFYADGQKLAAESATFKKKLDTKPIFDNWLAETTKKGYSVSGPIFTVTKDKNSGDLSLRVNFDDSLLKHFKEVRSLQTLGYQIPHALVSVAKEARKVFPYSTAISEGLNAYTDTLAKIKDNEDRVGMLLAGYQSDVNVILEKGMALRWENFAQLLVNDVDSECAAYVSEFTSCVSLFQEKAELVIDVDGEIQTLFEELRESKFSENEFSVILGRLQAAVDKLGLGSFASMDEWVSSLNKTADTILSDRLKTAMAVWKNAFETTILEDDLDKARFKLARMNSISSEEEITSTVEEEIYSPQIGKLIHTITVKNQTMKLLPSLDDAKSYWYTNFHDWLSNVFNLRKIKSSRYDMGTALSVLATSTETVETFGTLAAQLPEDLLRQVYSTILVRIREVHEYVGSWLQYQALWDLEPTAVSDILGTDLSIWHSCINEILEARSTIDNSETFKNFGSIEIDFGQIQAKVNAKYDFWQKDLLAKYASLLSDRMKHFHSEVLGARTELEKRASIDIAGTKDAVTIITLVEDSKKKAVLWKSELTLFKDGQRSLDKQRYTFSSDWIHTDTLESIWASFTVIFEKINNSIQMQIGPLRDQVLHESKLVNHRVGEAMSTWSKEKPIQGDLVPENALHSLGTFEVKFMKLKSEQDSLLKAKDALVMDFQMSNDVGYTLEELNDLRSVWTSVSSVYKSLQEIMDNSWASVLPRKIRQQLDGLLTVLKEMPSRMRQYAAFEYLQELLKGYVKSNSLLSDLKSDALRERHWKNLLKQLRVDDKLNFNQMTLGQVWAFDLKRNETIIREVLAVAQGEMALEEFISQVKDFWQNFSVELVPYQNKTRLIKGWDTIFEKCSENLSSLSTMKYSPYYRVFEEEAAIWEDKLNKLHVLFDVWIDVQRQWVYLEGIFAGSADIKHLLPSEYSRFQGINAEFLALMKRVQKGPFILEIIQTPNIQKSLERVADLLYKIQKALGDYLERERSQFPRFYFVGDEDLLEIIGNSKDVSRIQKHFKKMFAGIHQVVLNDDGQKIVGISSKEGEVLSFSKHIILTADTKINEWLSELETYMKLSLAESLADSVKSLKKIFSVNNFEFEEFLAWLDKTPAQISCLSVQILWTAMVEEILNGSGTFDNVLTLINKSLDSLADQVLQPLDLLLRKKIEHVISELVHERSVVRSLKEKSVSSSNDFNWHYYMRFYYKDASANLLERLSIKTADSSFMYGYEYLGLPERLVQTPLTDKCYLTLTQALHYRFGGSPFGPAGTGKTESVKFLGVLLGRFVLVFCCDENFDFAAMGRIFIGLCRTGAWGCFDEFNRLKEEISSAVSQQIQSIQEGLRLQGSSKTQSEIELMSKTITLDETTAVFITMNPGYAGRQNLPDNLKKLFRPIAMTKPDRQIIAEVMLFSQGFKSAESLSAKVVPFFSLCLEQLSPQSHYDFGLRALKSVLVSAGNIKRKFHTKEGESIQAAEQKILLRSIHETVAPKLLSDDIILLRSLLNDVFPSVTITPEVNSALVGAIKEICDQEGYVASDSWVEKVIQIYLIHNIHHGFMLVGKSSGKSTAWRTLLEALERVDGVEGVSYIINPKAVSKETLYGHLDNTTREWTDGLFTQILRRIVDNVRGEASKRHWIVFDGDVDPEWVENLNSVLDDNRLLTLPNGERIALPDNVRLLFEVDSLKYATLATVSRCGMVWFSEDTVDLPMIFECYLTNLKKNVINQDVDIDYKSAGVANILNEEDGPSVLAVQQACAEILDPYFGVDGLVAKCLTFAHTLPHIMEFSRSRALSTLFSLLNSSVSSILEYNIGHPDFPMALDSMQSYLQKKLLNSLVWSFAGDCSLSVRNELTNFIRGVTTMSLPSSGCIIDYDVDVNSNDWITYAKKVPRVEIEVHMVAQTDVVIPTVDTIRHEDVLYSWLSERKPGTLFINIILTKVILCGPPGSGKTMTLFSALRKLSNVDLIALNFSSATSSSLLLKTLEQHCEYRKTPSGLIMSPINMGKWLVVFCDEINLPALDAYGTQSVISFMRQLVENNGFYRPFDKSWVSLERIQFVGACNPPTDPGRVPMSQRFLRHTSVIMVDYPGPESLNQIYGTFNVALLKIVPSLRAFAEPLTNAMVSFHHQSQTRFTADMQAHYVYSPRELSRWVRGIYESLRPLESLSVEGLVRIWAHEALRLYQDRLVTDEERKWTDDLVSRTAHEFFPTINHEDALRRPILFSNWLNKNYISVDREVLREFVKARLKVFYEEELDVPLVLFNDVLDHVLRIDRVFHQPQGHLLLIGVSGCGKTTLARFVAWMNGLSIFQIQAHRRYTGADFEEDLKTILRRCGTKGEKICFILDESNLLESAFLERMNTLLANGEIPGLFEGDEFNALIGQCKEGAVREGLMLDSAEDLYKWFNSQIIRNLHVVFTMNPPEGGLASRAATSPALFNRCVLDWFGNWSDHAFHHVCKEFLDPLDIDDATYVAPQTIHRASTDLPVTPTYRDAIINAFVFVHQSLKEANARLVKRRGRQNYHTPRHFLDFIGHYIKIYNSRREDLEDQQRHINVGLDKLHETVTLVEQLRENLARKKIELERKSKEANDKLQIMVTKQQEAEQKKAASLDIQSSLAKQQKDIEERRKVVVADLAEAEPAVIEAQKSVSNIKKQHLTEVRSMGNPPNAVKMAMESVCTLLGNEIDSWKTVQQIIRRDDFITSIVNFDTDKNMTKAMRDKMNKTYLSNPDFNFESVNRASQACGPLVKWAIAQVRFSEILDKVGPLREEVEHLESTAEETSAKATVMEDMVKELEASIAQYKEDYAVLISETQQLKSEMEQVQSKVERSVKLIENLSSEKHRWETGSSDFNSQMKTMAGDSLLSAAYLAYGGFFDQRYRELLLQQWSNHMNQSAISVRKDLSLSEYLSSPDERITWQTSGLPQDNLCTENAIMMFNYNRYPLIIDPAGQALQFLKQSLAEKKVVVTSFLDSSFIKILESSMRFGNPIVIQDVESYDPILNPILNKEIRRTGGRVLIRLGSQDIDFSPSFRMFLITRDPTFNFPPDVNSRVTFVNFTITKESLQSQCLSELLKAERPDIDQKRTDLIKLQGEYIVKLRSLEKSLLSALSESQGNILENDAVVTTLETLKSEATEITQKSKDTSAVMEEVEAITQVYIPIASISSQLYFAIDQLQLINHFYQFSLKFFKRLFSLVIHNSQKLKSVKEPSQRLDIIKKELFRKVYEQCSQSLLHADSLILALLFAQINIGMRPDAVDISSLNVLFGISNAEKSLSTITSMNSSPLGSRLSDEGIKIIAELADLSGSKNLVDSLSDPAWLKLLEADSNLLDLIPSFGDMKDAISIILKKLVILKAVRPDSLIHYVPELVNVTFDRNFLDVGDLDMKKIALHDADSNTPIVLCSVPGFDASFRAQNLATSLSIKMSSIAMGSAEGFDLADKAIQNAASNGSWVLLKNTHLSSKWLSQLEKKIQCLNANPNFRLFLTMELNPNIPSTLLRASRVIMFEPAPGVKASVSALLTRLPESKVALPPAERARLYFIISWLHSVTLERLRYCPIGWSKTYEFNEADFDCALNVIDSWIQLASQGRSNLAPEKIPWEALRVLLKETVYGGRVDNEFDQQVLSSFIDSLFSAKSYEHDYPLVSGGEKKLDMPDGIKLDQFVKWCHSLDDQQPPEWLGLPADVDSLLALKEGRMLLSKVRKVRDMDDDDVSINETQGSSKQADVLASIKSWKSKLPSGISPIKEVEDNASLALVNHFKREQKSAMKLLSIVHEDLKNLEAVLEGKEKHTNRSREIFEGYTKGLIPSSWKKYKVASTLALEAWFADLVLRIKQLEDLGKRASFDKLDIWLGGLFHPEAFVTATRQYYARKNQWSLENLHVSLSSSGEGNIKLSGMFLQSAEMEDGRLSLGSSTYSEAPALSLIWSLQSAPVDQNIAIPVYLNDERTDLLFSAPFKFSGSDKSNFYSHGAALIASQF